MSSNERSPAVVSKLMFAYASISTTFSHVHTAPSFKHALCCPHPIHSDPRSTAARGRAHGALARGICVPRARQRLRPLAARLRPRRLAAAEVGGELVDRKRRQPWPVHKVEREGGAQVSRGTGEWAREREAARAGVTCARHLPAAAGSGTSGINRCRRGKCCGCSA